MFGYRQTVKECCRDVADGRVGSEVPMCGMDEHPMFINCRASRSSDKRARPNPPKLTALVSPTQHSGFVTCSVGAYVMQAIHGGSVQEVLIRRMPCTQKL